MCVMDDRNVKTTSCLLNIDCRRHPSSSIGLCNFVEEMSLDLCVLYGSFMAADCMLFRTMQGHFHSLAFQDSKFVAVGEKWH